MASDTLGTAIAVYDVIDTQINENVTPVQIIETLHQNLPLNFLFCSKFYRVLPGTNIRFYDKLPKAISSC